MKQIFRSRPAMTEPSAHATTFEIFFDLVFVFALTRIIAFMVLPPSALSLTRGLLLLLLLWFSWSSYAWLGNQARADRGLVRAGTIVAMAATFVAAMVIPSAWRPGIGIVNAPLTLALAYIVARAEQLVLYLHVAAGNQRLRRTLLLVAIPTTLAWIPLILGAVIGGNAQTALWATAFLIDTGGGRIASIFSGWQLRSPSHFTERHGLVLIIAIGESLIAVGTGAGSAVTRGPVLVAALLGLTIAVCLWWLYFEYVAPAAGKALAEAPAERRGQIASDAYSLAHFALVAGIIYIALGIEEVVRNVAHDHHGVGAAVNWASTAALSGGVVLYLAGRVVFLRLTVRSVPAAQLVATGLAFLLVPAVKVLPALAALGLVTAFLIAVIGYERHGAARHPEPGAPSPT